MKKLDVVQMENTNGGYMSEGTRNWCNSMKVLLRIGDINEIDSFDYASFTYNKVCILGKTL